MKRTGFLAIAITAICGLLFAETPKGHKPTRNLTIDAAVETALRLNPAILKSKQEIERTRGVVIEVRAQALPQISLDGNYNQQDPRLLSGQGSSSSSGQTNTSASLQTVLSQLTQSSTTGAAGGAGSSSELTQALKELQDQGGQSQQRGGTIQNKTWQVMVQARQLIYSGGQVAAAMRIAKLTQDSSFYQLRDTIDSVIATVRQEFYQVLLNRSTIRVQEESLRLLENQLGDQKNRFDAGTVPRFNVLQAEVALENARPDLIRARNNYRISQLVLARTLGVDYDAAEPNWVPFNVVGEMTVERRGYSLAQSVEFAKAHRPFLKIQRQQILIQGEQIKIALAGYQPVIQANGGYEVRNRITSKDIGDTINGWFFGFTGTWDIFDGLETYGKTKQAKAQLEQAKITYDDSTRQVELEVQEADAKLKEATELLQSADKTIEQAQESVRLAQERLNAGAGVQLDVLNARVALLQAQTTDLTARYDYQAALAEFDRATGSATRYEETFDDPLMRKATLITNPPKQVSRRGRR